MSTAAKLGVRVSNPGKVVSIEGETFGELVSFEFVHLETLKRAVAVLHQENPYGLNEALTEAQAAPQAMVGGVEMMLHEQLRWAAEQGLQFEMVSNGAQSH